MLLMIDNYDSFTYNLVQYFGELGEEVVVFRNDTIDTAAVEKLQPDKIVISPGPGRPTEAGNSCDIIRTCAGVYPILGVCLGHQCIGEVFGGKIVRARRIMHGKISSIHHNGKKLFRGLPASFEATRYHSLILDNDSLPACFTRSAWTDRDEIMGISHKRHILEGIQFHPESILTTEGKKLLKNFITIADSAPGRKSR